ncbi:MAG: hypothetical protein K0S27_885 [Gammaproteobacteria bacterium]|jgi:hypothetical protein|nr:hypothetical protein [Gammaproteobacteria bacterium]
MEKVLLEKSYYSTQEAIQILQNHGIHFNEDDLRYYSENETLKFGLYVGSRPAFAAKYDYENKNMFFIGHCNLHGIFPLNTADFCGIMANDNHLIEILSGHPHASRIETTNWSISLPNDVQQLRLGYEQIWTPEPYSPELKLEITFFYLRTEYRLFMKEGVPGAFLQLNIIPENIFNDAIKFDLGTPKQWPINQLFKKIDLRITHNNLQTFINFLKQKNSSSIVNETSFAPPAKEHDSPQLDLAQNNPKKKRRSKKCPRLVLLIKSYIDSGNSYDSFARDMLDAYLYKAKPSKDDAMHFNDDLGWMYLTEKSPNKYTFHYSVANERGKLIARQKSLITLRRYFHDISDQSGLKEKADT